MKRKARTKNIEMIRTDSKFLPIDTDGDPICPNGKSFIIFTDLKEEKQMAEQKEFYQ